MKFQSGIPTLSYYKLGLDSPPIHQYSCVAVPPLFGVNVDMDATHRKSHDRLHHWNAAVAGQCVSLYDNI